MVAGCSAPLVNEGDGALEVVLPYLKFPIGCSTFELFSTLNMLTPFELGDLNGGIYL
jgi:hypothetical protein